MKNILLTIIGLIFIAGCASAAGQLKLNDDTAKISYSLGYQIGGDFKQQKVGINADAVVQGIQDALAARDPQLSTAEMQRLLITLKKNVVSKQRKLNYQTSHKFMAANLKQQGVKELPGGTQYRVLKRGTGISPTLNDRVEIHFNASRTDGTTIASTQGTKAPRSYLVKKMLPGLQQALLKMKAGSKWQVFVTPKARGEKLEGSGVLIYDIELLAVHPASVKGS